MIDPEIEAEVTLLPEGVSPREGPIRADLIGFYGCPFIFRSEMFDCRMTFPDSDGNIPLGSSARALVQFLYPDSILPRLKANDAFELWEMGTIARGRVTRVIKGQQE
jgi:hypothetical protein